MASAKGWKHSAHIWRGKKVEEICEICPRHCKVNRGKNVGFCNEFNKIRISKIIDHFKWEEPCLNDEKGVCAIFFSGCNLKCDYCQNYEISCGQVGKEYSAEEFANLLREKEKDNSYFDFITPTHFSNEILSAFKIYRPKIPVIWNSSSYEEVEILKKLDEFVDIYLLDLKYADNFVGRKYSNCHDYFDKASKVLDFCAQKKDVFKDNLLRQGLIIRHLVLPNEIDNSLKVIDYIAKNFPDRIVSVMSQFTPTAKSSIKRKLTPLEYKIVQKRALNKLTKGYFQDFDSAEDSFIPKFLEEN